MFSNYEDDETLGMDLEQLEAAEREALAGRKRRTPSPNTESGDSPQRGAAEPPSRPKQQKAGYPR